MLAGAIAIRGITGLGTDLDRGSGKAAAHCSLRPVPESTLPQNRAAASAASAICSEVAAPRPPKQLGLGADRAPGFRVPGRMALWRPTRTSGPSRPRRRGEAAKQLARSVWSRVGPALRERRRRSGVCLSGVHSPVKTQRMPPSRHLRIMPAVRANSGSMKRVTSGGSVGGHFSDRRRPLCQ